MSERATEAISGYYAQLSLMSQHNAMGKGGLDQEFIWMAWALTRQSERASARMHANFFLTIFTIGWSVGRLVEGLMLACMHAISGTQASWLGSDEIATADDCSNMMG
jgi:hypothetical protein